jgi:hypothetical protein
MVHVFTFCADCCDHISLLTKEYFSIKRQTYQNPKVFVRRHVRRPILYLSGDMNLYEDIKTSNQDIWGSL